MNEGGLLISTSTFPLMTGDATPRFVWDLARHLTLYFPEVHVLAPQAKEAPAEDRRESVFIHRFAYFFPRKCQALCYGSGISQNLRNAPWLWLQVPFFLAAQLHSTVKIASKDRISVVNSHWLLFQGLTAGLAKRRSTFRHVCHVHAAELYALKRLPRRVGRATARTIVRRCDLVICESSYVRSSLQELTQMEFPSQISCMGVDANLFVPTPSPRRPSATKILFVGRLVEKKGVEYLIRAMPYLLARFPGLSLTIVGGGMLEQNLKNLAGRLSLIGKNVQFTGPQPHEKIVEMMRECDVFVVPSIVDSKGETEGMPTVLLEAMAAGKKVVASNVNGIPDVVTDGVNGWLVEPADSEQLASAIERALHHTDEKIVNAAVETARQYHWPVLAKRYAAWLKDA